MNKRKSKRVHFKDCLNFVEDGQRIMIGGFGLRGCPYRLIEALVNTGKQELTVISNDMGSPNEAAGRLLSNGQIKRVIGSHFNKNPDLPEAYNAGLVDVQLKPQGTFIESIRAAGAGIPAYYTKASVGTLLGKGKETRVFHGEEYVMEEAIEADIALIKAHTADEMGNLTYHSTARNFNPVMAKAAKITIAEVEHIVPTGTLKPEEIVTPHIYVDYILEVQEDDAID